MSLLFQVKEYISYFFRAADEHAVHSPFLFQLYTEVIQPEKQYIDFDAIEKLRASLLVNDNVIQITELGAGSLINKSKERKISDIASYSLKSPKTAQLIYKLVHRFKPDTIIELGTSLGITTLYEAKANSKAIVYSLEGCPETIKIAEQQFRMAAVDNIKVVTGDFNTTLPALVSKIPKIDFVFFDGNHRYQPTIQYFNTCLEKVHEDSVFVFDDIYWSSEMKKAWQEICNRPEVMISIDLFHLGVVFFRKNQPKQHYCLRF